MSNSQT